MPSSKERHWLWKTDDETDDINRHGCENPGARNKGVGLGASGKPAQSLLCIRRLRHLKLTLELRVQPQSSAGRHAKGRSRPCVCASVLIWTGPPYNGSAVWLSWRLRRQLTRILDARVTPSGSIGNFRPS